MNDYLKLLSGSKSRHGCSLYTHKAPILCSCSECRYYSAYGKLRVSKVVVTDRNGNEKKGSR